jgi:hypothetical protein
MRVVRVRLVERKGMSRRRVKELASQEYTLIDIYMDIV